MENLFTNKKATEIISRIEQLCRERCSGIVFIVTGKNIIAQLKLTEGDIVDIRYLAKRGMQALTFIFESAHFKQITFKEKSGFAMKARVDTQLPSQTQLWKFIKNVFPKFNEYDQILNEDNLNIEEITQSKPDI